MANESNDRTRTEEALRRSEARFAGILAIAADAIISIDDQLRITLYNEGAEKTFGYSRHEILGRPLDILIPERFRHAHTGHIRHFGTKATAARKMGERQEIFALHKDGHEFPAEASISKLEIDGERTYTVVLRDVSERKASEAALRESEQRLWAFLSNSSVVGRMKDEEGRYVFLSGNFQRRFGSRYENWMGKTDFDFWPREFAEEFQRNDAAVLAENREIDVLEEARNADGSRSWWLSHKFPFRDATGRRFVGGLGVDITERVKAEEALAQSNAVLETRVEERTRDLRDEMKRHQEAQSAVARLQRMDSLGQLTGGVAHDFNNLLTVITGNLQLIGMDLENGRLRNYLEEAERAAEMGARLNQRLVTFAKQRRLAPAPTDLNDQVIGVRELLRRSLGETITLTTELADDLWTVRVDPSEIENALVNLAINSRDAMPEGGRLTVSTHNVVLGESEARSEEGLLPGPYVRLCVTDTGVGMSPDVQARAFEPFFTTKGHGKGTGLGLATIYGFVKQSGGHITLASEPGRGTTVSIYLLKLDAGDSAAQPAANEPRRGRPNGEKILVVEDNAEVRRVTVARLEALGYKTIEAESGLQALGILEQGEVVALVFSDIVMPGGISGIDLARRIRERWPSLNILLTSGYAPDFAEGANDDIANLAILSKPYSQAALQQAIWTAIRDNPAQCRETSAVKT